MDNLPLIGYIDKNMLIATGYNAWGLTESMISAMVIPDLLNKRSNKYTYLFDPKRKFKISKYMNNIFSNIYAYSKMLLVKTPKCPHLGCHLIYDKKEKIWTCPCHGSKFSQDGQVIISPSNKNIN